jgi:hypothetical protein
VGAARETFSRTEKLKRRAFVPSTFSFLGD